MKPPLVLWKTRLAAPPPTGKHKFQVLHPNFVDAIQNLPKDNADKCQDRQIKCNLFEGLLLPQTNSTSGQICYVEGGQFITCDYTSTTHHL